MNARNNGLKNLLLSRPFDEIKVKKRFGVEPRKLYPTNIQMKKDGGSVFSFGTTFESCYLDGCLIVNTFQQIYRIKPILNLTIISKKLSISDFMQDMKRNLMWPVENTLLLNGLYYIPNRSAWAYMLSGQFTNMFLIPGIRETNIGQFLMKNRNFVKYSLNCIDFLQEQRLEWKEGNPLLEEKYIQPDFLLKMANGFYDLCDLKTPLLEKTTLTKDKHARRRFIDYVQEGIAQLANYEHYFSFSQNSDYAKHEFEISVRDPQLILVVGNYENVDINQVHEASRMLKPNITIIDYDTLNANFLLHATS